MNFDSSPIDIDSNTIFELNGVMKENSVSNSEENKESFISNNNEITNSLKILNKFRIF